MAEPSVDLAASRRRLSVEALGIAASAIGFGFVYGLAARGAGFSPIEAMAMSVLVFGGAAQFAAVGYVANGLAWPGVILLTALLNARHILYSAALAPWLRERPIWKRAVMAHLLTDEAFALSIAHFQRVGRADDRGYRIAAIVSTFIPWNLATVAGVTLGGQIADPAALGLDVVFPAAMAGLCVGLVTGRRELVAAAVGATVGVSASLAVGTGIGIIAGGVLGPLAGLLVPAERAHERAPLGTPASAERYAMPGAPHAPFAGRESVAGGEPIARPEAPADPSPAPPPAPEKPGADE
ncbi:MAG: AzlC family ABC transporter permease [Chloroflexota bacterium]|nr:AzlC family ABC transporter permease [Chloroflexota bacterium]